jgi:hypothetical protein
MSTINITDKLGLNIAVTPGAASALHKYLKDPEKVYAELGTVKGIQNLKISDDPFNSQSLGLTFKEPVKLGSTGAELDIQPALLATVAIATGKPLFDGDNDPFGDTVSIAPDKAYLSLGIQATLDLSLSDKSGDLKFGFTNQTKVVLTDYRLFPKSDPIVPALKTLVTNYTIPGDIPDIEAMPESSIATVAGSGSLKFSGEWDLPAGVNPLATVTDTVAAGALSLKAGGSANVKASFTLTGGYQIRVQRLAGRKFRLGVLKQRSTEFDVTATAELGASATLAGTDWIQEIMKVASTDPVPDKDTLKKGGLTDDQISSINAAVKAGVERSLQLSLSAELDSLNQSSTAFTYDIDLDQVYTDQTGASASAINLALDGDLTKLETPGLRGVTLGKSVASSLKERKQILKLNLLGIFNFVSISEMVQTGKVIVDHDSGAVTITDKTTATRIGFSTANFAKDSAKLRQILAESVMITAAYRTGRIGPVAQFGATLWFFEFRHKTKPENIKDYLNICTALGVPSVQQIAAALNSLQNSGKSLGQSTFNVDATYDDALFQSLFLTGVPARTVRQETEYDNIARQALAALVLPGDPTSDARRIPLTDDPVWLDLRSEFNQDSRLTAFFTAHPALKNYSAVIMTDFLLIVWWSSAMSRMAKALAALLTFYDTHPNWTKDDNQFKQLHKALNKAVGGVASDTRNDFREPLGLLAMDRASGRIAPTTVQLSSACLSFFGVR